MEPAATIIHKLGGLTKVARIVGVHPSRVSMWRREREIGGTGGRVPQSHHLKILKAAEEQGVDISAETLLPQEIES